MTMVTQTGIFYTDLMIVIVFYFFTMGVDEASLDYPSASMLVVDIDKTVNLVEEIVNLSAPAVHDLPLCPIYFPIHKQVYTSTFR